MKINPAVLKPHPLLALLPYSTVKRLLTGSAVSELSKGTVVFSEGDRCDALFVIISGRCEGRVRGRNGSEIVEEVYGPGDTLGDRAFLNAEPHHCTVTVSTHCVLLRIPAEELEGLFTKDAAVAGKFAQTVTRKLRAARDTAAARGDRVRRIVSLMGMGPRVNATAAVEKLAAALVRITGRKVLLVRLTADTGAQLPVGEPSLLSRVIRFPKLQSWASRERVLDGEFSLKSELRENVAGFQEIHLPVGTDPQYAEEIAPMISDCGRHFDYVVLHADSALPAPVILQCVIQTDLAYVLLQPSVQCLYDFQLLAHALAKEMPRASSHVKPIVFAEEAVDLQEFHDILKRMGHPVHSFARGFPEGNVSTSADRRYELHINRLAREVARCRIGLALSSGGAKGLAHVGVIQVLEEHGIEVDAIAGASMGAYVGSLWAYGLDGAALEKIAREHEGRWGLLSLVDPKIFPRRGFLSTRRLARRLRRSLGRLHFSDLIRPLRVVVTNLDTLQRVVFGSGEVARAVEASVAIPGICAPINLEGEDYVDGGVSDPLPVDVLQEMGIERIIAVNAIPTSEKLRLWRSTQAEPNGREWRFWLFRWLNQHLNFFARGNVFDNMIQAFLGAQTLVAESSTRNADVVLRPVACDGRWYDVRHPGKYIALGRAAAEEQLPAILALAHQSPDETQKVTPPLAVASALAAA
jgi:NTE family protein